MGNINQRYLEPVFTKSYYKIYNLHTKYILSKVLLIFEELKVTGDPNCPVCAKI